MMKDINETNIFKYATKELTQDAFFCWLVTFAKPEYAKSESLTLHYLALDFFKCILNYNQPIETLEVKTQVNGIDIWLEVNCKNLIIIEDKTFSHLGDNQLRKYFESAESFVKRNSFETLQCIYFKFGLESERSFTRNEFHNKWSKKTLRDLLQVFSKYENKIKHPFFIDYYEIAKVSNRITEDFSKLIIPDNNNIENKVLEAFYKKLETDQVFLNWKFVDQRGARNYYANDYVFKEEVPTVYIQLDKLALRLKIDLIQLKDEKGKKYKKFQDNLKSNDIRYIYDSIRNIFEKNLPYKIDKPSRFAPHNFLTVATFDRSEWLSVSNDGTLNYEVTKNNLSKINQDVKEKNVELISKINDIVNHVFNKKTQK